MKLTKRFVAVQLAATLCASTFAGGLSVTAKSSLPYEDVDPSAWYMEGITSLYDQKIMTGTSSNTFSPDMNLSRGMVSTLLYRMEGSPVVDGTGFGDVPEWSFYKNSSTWAKNNGLMLGNGNATFDGEDAIRRQDLALVLQRYNLFKNGLDASLTSLSQFKDANQVSDYALTAVKWAVAHEILSGKANRTLLDPLSSTTRAEAATILNRYLNAINNPSQDEKPSEDKTDQEENKPSVTPMPGMQSPSNEAGGNTSSGNSSVKDPILTNLQASENVSVVNENVPIIFTVNLDQPVEQVELLLDGTPVANLKDDGQGKDEEAGDGIFTVLFNSKVPETGIKKFVARYGQSQSNSVEIQYHNQPTSQDFEALKGLKEEINRIEADSGSITQEKDKVIQLLNERDDVESYEVSDTTNPVLIHMNSGLNLLYAPTQENLSAVGKEVDVTVVTLQPCNSSFLNRNDPAGELAKIDETATTIAGSLSNYTFSINKDDGDVDLETIKNFGPNQVIFWQGHGGYHPSIHSFLETGETYQEDLNYLDNMQLKILPLTDGNAAITAYFIDSYVEDMNHSFIYLGTCDSATDPYLANTFLKKNAEAVIANVGSIYTAYDLLMTSKIGTLLSQRNQSTNDYYTLQEALNEAKAEIGERDLEWFNQTHPGEKGKVTAAFPTIYGNKNYQLRNTASSVPPHADWNTKFAGGDGTQDHPFQISTATQLDAIRYCNSKQYYFELINDIDLDGFAWRALSVGSYTPDYVASYAISAHLDGKGFTIRNLNTWDLAGGKTGLFSLMGQMQTGYEVHDLNMEGFKLDVSLKDWKSASGSIEVGAIASQAGGDIYNCKVSGEINLSDFALKSNSDVGGLVGYSIYKIYNCTNNMDITIDFEGGYGLRLGGIAGFSNGAHNLYKCTNTGNILINSSVNRNFYIHQINGYQVEAQSQHPDVSNDQYNYDCNLNGSAKVEYLSD